MKECHCGKDGHPLNSMNCPVHGYVVINLPPEEFEAFQRAIDNPATPSDKLRELFRRAVPWGDRTSQ